MSIWMKVEDFNFQSWDGQSICAVCGSPKKKHHIHVFRPPHPDDVSGFFDICEDCMRQAADELGLGETTGLTRSVEVALKDLAKAQEEKVQLQEALATVTRMNVTLQDEIDELNAPMEVPFEDEDDDE